MDVCGVLVPTHGLVVYCGTVMTEEGKEKKVNIDFEPFRPINTSLYLCDNKFHTEVWSFFAMALKRIVIVTVFLMCGVTGDFRKPGDGRFKICQ